MNRAEYLSLMNFPSQWEEWNMIPDEWLIEAISSYQPGNENASEHDRHGAFQWWLRHQHLEANQLVSLAKLTFLDPEPLMGEYVRQCITEHKGYCKDVEHALQPAT